MPMSSKFLTESTGEKNMKIGQYLAKIRTKYDSLLFFGPPCKVHRKKVKVVYSSSRETGCHLRFWITQCYLPPDTSDAM